MNILVLDVGTSSMRGTLLDQDAAVHAQEQITYQPQFLDGGRVEQNPREWLDAMTAICRRIGAAETVDAVAVTSQRSSVIPLDENHEPLTDAIMWQDTRNRELCDSLTGHEDTVRSTAGTGINTVFSGGKMAWLRQERPDVYEQAARLCVIPDYLIFRMTGEFVTDRTYGSRSMLMDLRTGMWSEPLLALFGVEERKLCKLISACSVAGTLTEEFSACSGLPAGIPVVTCGGDQQCGAAGQGVILPGTVSVNLGTGAYLIVAADRVPDDLPKGMICNASAVPDQYILEASVLTCGAALDWYLSLIGEDVSFVGQALQKSPPGANGVRIQPWFQGRSFPNWDSAARASIQGLTLSATREDLLRALLEGIFDEICESLRAMETLQNVETICLSGGLSRTDEVCGLLADMTGKTVFHSDGGDATSRGAWMSAAVCLGLAGSWSEAWEKARTLQKEFTPDADRHGFYLRGGAAPA